MDVKYSHRSFGTRMIISGWSRFTIVGIIELEIDVKLAVTGISFYRLAEWPNDAPSFQQVAY